MGLNATVRKLLTRNPGSSAIDAARVRNSAQVSPTDVANSITSVQRQIDAVVTVALADQTVSDPITVSGEDGGQIGWIGTVVQNAVSYLGMWFQNFWLGGTSPATAQIYSDSIGDVFIDGAEIVNTLFELNLNGVTTSIENLNSAVGVLSIKSLSNSTSYYSGATPTGFELLDNLGNSLGSLRSSGGSGHLDLSNVAATNTINLITGGGGAPKLSITSAAGTVSISPGTPLSVFGNTVIDSSRNATVANITSTGHFNQAYPGAVPAVSAANQSRIYTDATGVLKVSQNGAAYVSLVSTATPGGADTQVQFNNSGAFGASASLTWDGATLTSLAMSTSALLVTSSGIGVTGASSITSASAAETLNVANTGGGNAIKATAGILVTAGGLSVSAGGLSIVAGGFSVVGGIVANGNTGFTGTLAAAISGGRNVMYGIIY
jgi:hypothetical protein